MRPGARRWCGWMVAGGPGRAVGQRMAAGGVCAANRVHVTKLGRLSAAA